MTQPLYLQYRAQSFDTLIGQSHISTILRQQVATHQTAHTYIFYGPRGVGKTSTARIFAKAVNCTQPIEGNPCGECANCILIASGASIDITEIDAASYTGVDTMRELIIDKIDYPPTQLRKKVYIIDEAHMLSKSSFNALLKVMEEAPEYVIFILATTEVHKVPETILSRAQLFQFTLHTIDDIVAHLRHIATQEKINAQDDALIAIARLADGGLRDAIKYFDQTRIGGDITMERVTTFLGIVPHQRITSLLDALVMLSSWSQIDTQLKALYSDGVDRTRLTHDILGLLSTLFDTNPAVYQPLVRVFMDLAKEIKHTAFPHLLYRNTLYAYIVGMTTETIAQKNNTTKGSSPMNTHTHIHEDTPQRSGQGSGGSFAQMPNGEDILTFLRSQTFGKTIDTALAKSTSFIDRIDTTYRYVVVNLMHHKALTKAYDTLLSQIRTTYTDNIDITFHFQTKDDFISHKPLFSS